MKSCPVCKETYADETLRFCLQDGAVLEAIGSGGIGMSGYDLEGPLVLPSDIGGREQPTIQMEEHQLEAALAAASQLAAQQQSGASAAAPPFVEKSKDATPQQQSPIRRDKIFISYSHQDREWLQRLRIHLKPYFQHDDISTWDDGQIKPGTKWFTEIDHALSSACVAVLLITPDFFASEFINDVELPRLKEAAQTQDLEILWVAVRASAISATEIGDYQGLNNPAEPLANLSPAAQDAKLVEICKEIKQRTRARTIESSPPEPATGLALTPLRTFEINMADIGPALVDTRGRFWVANAQQVKIFEVKQAKPVETWLLPKRRWKQHLDTIWRDQLLISSWDGSLYQFDGHSAAGEHSLYQAQPDDLPIHRLAVGPDGQLAAVTWNSLLRRWNAEGELISPVLSVGPYLHLHLMPLAKGALALLDQANYLRLYDAEGRELWTRRLPEKVERIWAAGEAGRRTFVAQINRDRLLKLTEGATEAEEVCFDEPILALGRGVGRGGEEWIIIAREGGKVDWLSTSLFSIVIDNSVGVDFAVREILSVYDPQQPANLIALGVTEEGQLFTLNERQVSVYQTRESIERLVLDPASRFLFLMASGQASVYRNPAILPARCMVELAGPVAGRLEVGGFKKLTVKLRNSGLVPIHEIRAELVAPGIIEPAKSKLRQPLAVRPGETVELEFSVRAKVHGDLMLDLRAELADEGGPPFSTAEIGFSIESIAATSRSSQDAT